MPWWSSTYVLKDFMRLLNLSNFCRFLMISNSFCNKESRLTNGAGRLTCHFFCVVDFFFQGDKIISCLMKLTIVNLFDVKVIKHYLQFEIVSNSLLILRSSVFCGVFSWCLPPIPNSKKVAYKKHHINHFSH